MYQRKAGITHLLSHFKRKKPTLKIKNVTMDSILLCKGDRRTLLNVRATDVDIHHEINGKLCYLAKNVPITRIHYSRSYAKAFNGII